MPRATAVFALAVLLSADVASAGGLWLPTRGVRPSARGGAFVAGADDLGAVWFNPAGLSRLAGREQRYQFLVDVAYVEQDVSYRRIDSGNNPQPEVENQAGGLPIPTLAASMTLGEDSVVSAAIYAPYAGVARYPEDGPQRYSVVDLSGSALAIFEVAYARRFGPRWRVGVGVQNMVARFVARTVVSGCPETIVCAPEDPDFDAPGQITLNSYFNPSAVLGAQYQLVPELDVGVAVQLPFRISAGGAVDAQLPNAAFYDSVELQGEKGNLRFWLPPILRAGAEYRLSKRLEVEASATIEFWSVHQDFEFESDEIQLDEVPGIGTYEVGAVIVERDFRTSYAFHLGAEGRPLGDMPLTVMAGYILETSAVPERTLSVLAVDGRKHVLSAGAGYRSGRYAVTGMVGYALLADRRVRPGVGEALQVTPLRRDNPVEVPVNWGDYSSSWLFAGAAVEAGF